MARTIAFCQEKALATAIQVFWTKGYEATSMEDLVGAMGIGRQSLYNTFGDKHSLFVRAVAQQAEHYAQRLRDHFTHSPSVRRAFAQLFNEVTHRCDAEKRRGCLMINSAMELAGRDLQIADLVARNQRNQEEIFYEALNRAQSSGELGPDIDCRKTARYFVGCAVGLNVMAKSDPTSPALQVLAQTALEALGR